MATADELLKLADLEGHIADAIRDGLRTHRGWGISFDLSEAVAQHVVSHLRALAKEKQHG